MSKKSGLVIVTPIWQPQFSPIELRRIQSSLKLNSIFPHFFLAPEGLDTVHYHEEFPSSSFKFFPSKFFRSVNDYNRLLLTKNFYETFQDFHHMLILQSDAILINPIDYQAMKEFDYIGAPWEKSVSIIRVGPRLFINSRLSRILPSTRFQVGNGGLCFRNVKMFQDMFFKSPFSEIIEFASQKKLLQNEDVVWSYLCAISKAKVPSADQAGRFFMETTARETKNVPKGIIGFHDLETHNPELELMLIEMGG